MWQELSRYGIITIDLIIGFFIVMVFLNLFRINYQLKKMTSLDMIMNFTLGTILGWFITNDNVSIINFIVIMSIYVILAYVINTITKKTSWGRKFFIGESKIIIKNGKVNQDTVNEISLSIHDLAAALRDEDIHSLTEIKMAQIEPNGDLSIVKKGQKDYSVIIIDNGVLDESALETINKTKKWLNNRLAAKNIEDIKDVFIAQWHKNKLYVVKKG